MFKQYFLIYLLAHLLADYYFQNDELAQLKNRKADKLIQHNCIYMAVCIIVILPVFSLRMLLSAVAAAIMHAVIDSAKYFYMKYFMRKKISSRTVYLLDQGIHLTCLIIISYIMTVNKYKINVIFPLNSLFIVMNVSKAKILSWAVIFLFIFKPANVTIKQLLFNFKPYEKMDNIKISDKNAGGFIGSLERLIIVIFLSMNQFSAIGLVLTAKSVARYNKISEDKDFAEYYLLGTLLSTVFAIIIYMCT